MTPTESKTGKTVGCIVIPITLCEHKLATTFGISAQKICSEFSHTSSNMSCFLNA
ncbi:hypothetical protein [Vibrio gallaecicus]|uniref:hypothetical protein n=1 Tax=Vibrio gallaecicus TaxID=552386 RepID=UPI0025B62492|nr:hypothetical protein [Vibrio gallaecicus]MDN3614275.1 hypothetical protein [Vibrio gallaecicus]